MSIFSCLGALAGGVVGISPPLGAAAAIARLAFLCRIPHALQRDCTMHATECKEWVEDIPTHPSVEIDGRVEQCRRIEWGT
ncbi:hypothetical protein B296_00048440 [Ensete ventricosum]|uniref:Secreted protein n=1 Tax=Ensete ventricosum TaxID=4639 RepID=A0A426X1M1_ENSVE|nr:hypothetical protein B296_00048440 [Ensete ventricosum]